jgi:hypothetical protein
MFPTPIRASCHGISAAAGKLGAALGSYGFATKGGIIFIINILLQKKPFKMTIRIKSRGNLWNFCIFVFAIDSTNHLLHV